MLTLVILCILHWHQRYSLEPPPRWRPPLLIKIFIWEETRKMWLTEILKNVTHNHVSVNLLERFWLLLGLLNTYESLTLQCEHKTKEDLIFRKHCQNSKKCEIKNPVRRHPPLVDQKIGQEGAFQVGVFFCWLGQFRDALISALIQEILHLDIWWNYIYRICTWFLLIISKRIIIPICSTIPPIFLTFFESYAILSSLSSRILWIHSNFFKDTIYFFCGFDSRTCRVFRSFSRLL